MNIHFSKIYSKNIQKKNFFLNRNKNLKQSFNNSHISEYKSEFYSKKGKTTKTSPINFNKQIMKYNKNLYFEERKNKAKSNSKKSSRKKSKEEKKNSQKDYSSKLNKNFINSIINITHMKNDINKSNKFKDRKTQNSSCNQTKLDNNNDQKKGEQKKDKLLKRNLLINNNNSNKNDISNFNLITSTKQSHNLKVMKIINKILTKKDKKDKKYFNNTIKSRKNTNSRENTNSKSKNNKSYNIQKAKNIYNNNKKIKNLKKNTNISNFNIKRNKQNNLKRKNIVRNIEVFINNQNKYKSLIDKYPNKIRNNNKLIQNIKYSNFKSNDSTQISIDIKNKQNKIKNINNSFLLDSEISNIIKKRIKKKSKMKIKRKENFINIIELKKQNYLLSKYNENLNSNLIYKSFPLTLTHTKNNDIKKIEKNKNKTKSKSNKKKDNFFKKYNNININQKTKTKFIEKKKRKTQSDPKRKKNNSSNKKYKEYNNIYINRYTMNKSRKNIISIDFYYNKINKFNKKNNTHINKKSDFPKRNNHNINNFIINILQNKSTYPNSNNDFQKNTKYINLTTSLIQSKFKEDKDTVLKIDKNNLNSHSLEKFNDKNNNIKNDLLLPINDKDFYINYKDSFYYNEISKKLSIKIKKYGKEHNFKEYPKTDLSFYKIGRSLGHGAFGKVNIALHVLSGHIVAIKSFNKNKNIFSLNKIKNEVKIMNRLRKNNNIVKLFEFFEINDYYCLVMENIVGGNLLNAINKMNKIPENLSKIIFKQLILTLKYIHSQNIVHRDIKPDNILLDLDNTIKLCDFGVSKIIPKGQLTDDSCGTPAFIAPEILLEKPYNPYLTDIWSCGVVLYVMITGFFPFRGINETQLHENILTGIYPKPKDISKELSDLLSKILNIFPNKRISIEQILKHPWLNNNNDDINLVLRNKDFNLSLFTKAEKIIYGKMKLNYKNIAKDIQIENFTNKNIDSYYEEENQNVQTMSFIFTPYNSNREKYDDEDLYYDDVNIENGIMKFNSKVQEISRLYEIHNNYEFDQGYIIDKKEIYRKKIKVSIKNTYQKDKNQNNNKNNEINDLSDSNLLKINVVLNKENFLIDEEALKYVENFGYQKEYIIKSLELNELNHATATYYLKLSLNK